MHDKTSHGLLPYKQQKNKQFSSFCMPFHRFNSGSRLKWLELISRATHFNSFRSLFDILCVGTESPRTKNHSEAITNPRVQQRLCHNRIFTIIIWSTHFRRDKNIYFELPFYFVYTKKLCNYLYYHWISIEGLIS